MFYGGAVVFGRDYSYGRTTTITPNTQISTAGDGSRRSRVRGKARRTVSVKFPAIDVTQFSGESQSDQISIDDSWTYATTAADDPVRIGGIIDYLSGPGEPILYLPWIPKMSGGADSETMTWQRCRGAIYGRLTGSVTLTGVLGDESVDEVISIASLKIEEEV